MPRAGQGGPKITLPCFLALARAVPVASFTMRRRMVPTSSLLVTITGASTAPGMEHVIYNTPPFLRGETGSASAVI